MGCSVKQITQGKRANEQARERERERGRNGNAADTGTEGGLSVKQLILFSWISDVTTAGTNLIELMFDAFDHKTTFQVEHASALNHGC